MADFKFYRLTYETEQLGTCLQWAGSKRGAARRKKDIRKVFGRDVKVTVEAIDFPKTRKGAIDWLNANCKSKMQI